MQIPLHSQLEDNAALNVANHHIAALKQVVVLSIATKCVMEAKMSLDDAAQTVALLAKKFPRGISRPLYQSRPA